MSASKRTQRWLVATLAASSLAGGPWALADTPEPIQRLGRFFGAGWGDGYHACETSGFRPLANLPPASFYQRDGKHPLGAGRHPIGGAGLETAIGSFYGACGNCGRNGCDAHGCSSCDTLACDSLGPTFLSETGRFSGPDETEGWHCPPSSSLDRDPSPAKPSLTPGIHQPTLETPPESSGPIRPQLPKKLPALGSDHPDESPASPSDGASAAGKIAWPPQLAANLHESQMRPIRPLPPQPKRQLSQPDRIGSPSTAPRNIDQQWPSSTPAVNSLGSERHTGVHRVAPPGVQFNSFMEGTASRPVVASSITAPHSPRVEPPRVDSADRVAEVPDWLIIRQPTR